ncbi:hypothetical protein HRbin20_00412 [bacterium HR20]|jgi:cell division protein FtsB|nr:hypothetical protein HRbin20_00412 [bacterium HR20]
MEQRLILRTVKLLDRLLGIAQRPRTWLVGGAIVLAVWLMFSRYGLLTRVELEHNDTALDAAIAEKRRMLDSLRQYATRLERDTLLLEQLARERYGMIRPGEIVLVVVDSSR